MYTCAMFLVHAVHTKARQALMNLHKCWLGRTEKQSFIPSLLGLKPVNHFHWITSTAFKVLNYQSCLLWSLYQYMLTLARMLITSSLLALLGPNTFTLNAPNRSPNSDGMSVQSTETVKIGQNLKTIMKFKTEYLLVLWYSLACPIYT